MRADGRTDRERWRHREDPDLHEIVNRARDPGAGPAPPRLAKGASRYGWFLGVVLVLGLAYITLNSIRSKGPGSRGVAVGRIAPPFAAPLVAGGLNGDVNVAVKAGQGDAGKVPACSVRGPEVLNLCELYERGPVVLSFFATRGAQCTRQLDVLERVRGRHPGVGFAAISIRGDRGQVARLIRDHGWRFPVGYDADGILANVYGVAVCPQITFVRRGGRVAGTSFGELGAGELDRRVAALQRPAGRTGG